MFTLLLGTWYVWAFMILAVAYGLYKPKIKGYFGEKMISGILHGLPQEEYSVVNDIILNTGNSTTQIDHIVISIYGIFVIETKNYKGWIFGSEKSSYWTQTIYKKKIRFMNPIHQNYKHVLALKELLSDYGTVKIIPIVAFSGNCELKIDVTSHVTYYSQVRNIVDSYKESVITPAQVVEIANILDKYHSTSNQREQHISQIQSRIMMNDYKISANICPRCGGQLVERIGRYGKFIGCNNYPKCRYTKK